MNLTNDSVMMVRETKKAKFLPHGVLQILIFFGLFLVSQIISSIYYVIRMIQEGTTELKLTGPSQLFIFGISMIIFLVYMIVIERRNSKSIGFSRMHALKDYSVGYLIGTCMFALIMFVLYITGNMSYNGVFIGSTSLIILFFIGFLIQGMAEEVMLRGYLLNSLSARHNIVIAIIINSSIFGILHLFNPNVSVLSILNIILFGVFASIYALKFSNIWGICALHSAWNFVQGNIFGLEVSGQNMSENAKIFEFSAKGSTFLNGGEFGPEGGIVTTIVLVIATIIIYSLKLKRNEEEQQLV